MIKVTPLYVSVNWYIIISITISTLLGIQVPSYRIINIVVMNTFIHIIFPYFEFPKGELMG